MRRFDLRDPYRLAVTLTWPRFLLLLLGIEITLNLLFASLFLARPGAVANAHPGSLTDAFFFSIETLATVGYGEMYPADLYGHVVSAVEIVTGVGFVAIATGLIFVRVSRPKPCFRYSDLIVICRHLGRPTMMIRVASDRTSVLYDAEARLSLLVGAEDAELPGSRAVLDLPLVRPGIPVLALAWTLMHVIDENSPLFGLDGPAMMSAGYRFFLTIRADDPTLSTTVRDLRAYTPDAVQFGMRYSEAISMSSEGHPVLNLERLGLVEPEVDERSGGQEARESGGAPAERGVLVQPGETASRRPMTLRVSPTSFEEEALAGSTAVILLDRWVDVALAIRRQMKLAGARVVVCGTIAEDVGRTVGESAADDWRLLNLKDREAVAAALTDLPIIDHLVLLAGCDVLPTAVDHRLSLTGSVTMLPAPRDVCCVGNGSEPADLLRSLRMAFAPRRINVISRETVCMTDMSIGSQTDGAASCDVRAEVSGRRKNAIADEVAAAVLFLATSSFIDGETFLIATSQSFAAAVPRNG